MDTKNRISLAIKLGSHPLKSWRNIGTKLIKYFYNSSVLFFFTSTITTLFTPACISLATDDSERTKTWESTVK